MSCQCPVDLLRIQSLQPISTRSSAASHETPLPSRPHGLPHPTGCHWHGILLTTTSFSLCSSNGFACVLRFISAFRSVRRWVVHVRLNGFGVPLFTTAARGCIALHCVAYTNYYCRYLCAWLEERKKRGYRYTDWLLQGLDWTTTTSIHSTSAFFQHLGNSRQHSQHQEIKALRIEESKRAYHSPPHNNTAREQS